MGDNSGKASGRATLIDMDFISTNKMLQELHYPPKRDERIEYHCLYHSDNFKTNWTLGREVPLVCKQTGNSDTHIEYTYEVDTSFDMLKKCSFEQSFPELVVTNKICEATGEPWNLNLEIAWCENLLTNMIDSITFEYGKKACGYLDRTILDTYPQLFAKNKPGWRDNYDINVGNTDLQLKWTNHLHAFSGIVELPWYFSKHQSFNFPLYYNREAKVEFKLNIHKNIHNLLRIRWRKNSKSPWIYVPPPVELQANFTCTHSWDPLIAFINGLDINNPRLTQPNMIAEYSNCTPEELDFHLGITPRYEVVKDEDGTERIVQVDVNKRIYWADDFVHHIETMAVEEYGEIKMSPSTSTPCKSFIILAENNLATERNNRSNYSTDADNIDSGFCPTVNITLKYGTESRVKNLSTKYCIGVIAPAKFDSCPYKPGYVPYSFSDDNSINGDYIGIPFDSDSKVEITAKLTSSNSNKNYNVIKPSTIGLDFLKSEVDNIPQSDDKENFKLLGQKKIQNYDDAIFAKVHEKNVYTMHVIMLVIRKFVFKKINKTDVDKKPIFILDLGETM